MELRGIWITNVDSDVLTSKRKIAEAMDFLADSGFNIVFPVVWNKAYTLYPSDVMQELTGDRMDPLYGQRDPLQELIVEAHRRGMEVMPWFEYGFAAGNRFQTNYVTGGRILQARPEWASADAEGNLVEKNHFEWLNAFNPEVQGFLIAMMMEVANRYDVDGVQGDDRLPGIPSTAGYDAHTVGLYRAQFGEDPPADHLEPQWLQFRADLLTEFLAYWRQSLREVDPNLMLSSSPSIHDWALRNYLQDSPTWMRRGLVDIIHPQAYRRDFEGYRRLIDEMVTTFYPRESLWKLSPGILIKVGQYRISAELMLEKIAYNRQVGVNGEVFFFYTGLRENENELGMALAEGPYAQRPALLPHRHGRVWRPGAIVAGLTDATMIGPWKMVEREGETFAALRGGQDGEITWPVSIPHAATYNVYVKLPWNSMEERSSLVTMAMQPPAGKAIRVTAEVPGYDEGGWIHVTRLELNDATAEDLAQPWEFTVYGMTRNEAKMTFASEVMLLLDRKASPEVDWAAAQ